MNIKQKNIKIEIKLNYNIYMIASTLTSTEQCI